MSSLTVYGFVCLARAPRSRQWWTAGPTAPLRRCSARAAGARPWPPSPTPRPVESRCSQT
eukprot:6581345-Pyramimonas_sp.AAC.1